MAGSNGNIGSSGSMVAGILTLSSKQLACTFISLLSDFVVKAEANVCVTNSHCDDWKRAFSGRRSPSFCNML